MTQLRINLCEHKVVLGAHHKQSALSLCLIRGLGQAALIQLDKETLAVKEREKREKREREHEFR